MDRKELESQFTSMLVRTDTHQAYFNLVRAYFTTSQEPEKLSVADFEKKLKDLRDGNPREWLSKVFSEGLEMPTQLYQVNTLWLKRLEDIGWE